MKRWSVLVDNSEDVSASPASALSLFGKENIGWSVSTELQSSSFILCKLVQMAIVKGHVSFWIKFPLTERVSDLRVLLKLTQHDHQLDNSL
jgi:hypothetical protein